MHITLPSSLRHGFTGEAPWDHPKIAPRELHDDPRHVPRMMRWVPIVVPLVALTMLLMGAAILSQA